MAHTADLSVTVDPRVDSEENLYAESDSDWSVGHSTTGFVLMLAGCPIVYSSKRQPCIALSSTEAEIIAASTTASEVCYVRTLLAEMGLEQDEPTTLYVDNSGAVELSRDRKSCHRSRHVDRRFFKVRELEAAGAVSVREINTNDNPADLLTKSLLFAPFRRYSMSLLGKSAPERAHSRARGVIASMTVCLPSEGGDERSDERVCARDCMCATRRW